MSSSEFSEKDLRELHALLQSAALEAYPNPERAGCPGPAILQAIAATVNPSQHPSYKHVATCSPCLREMLAFRGERVRVQKAQQRRRRLALAASVAAFILVAVAAYVWSKLELSSTPTQQASAAHVIVGELDYQFLSNERGPASPKLPDQILDKSVTELMVRLPVGSEAGVYTVQIRKGSRIDEAIANFQGTASMKDGSLRLQVKVDLSKIGIGTYVAAWRRVGAHGWDYGTFVLK